MTAARGGRASLAPATPPIRSRPSRAIAPLSVTSPKAATAPRSAAEQLTLRLCRMSDDEVTNLYVRMVRSRDYMPVNEVGHDLFEACAEEAHATRLVLDHIGRHCRDRLGIGG